jgi:hypothetical protein
MDPRGAVADSSWTEHAVIHVVVNSVWETTIYIEIDDVDPAANVAIRVVEEDPRTIR